MIEITLTIDKQSVAGMRAYGYNNAREFVDIPFSIPQLEESDVQDVQEESKESLFDLIFTRDPLTLMAVGDVAMYLGKNVNPEIKRFIELNLHSPVSLDAETSGKFADISDDDVAELTRGREESLGSYTSRVREYFLSVRDSELKKE